MAYNFFFNKITYKKEEQSTGLMVCGEIINNTGKSFNSVVFRAVLFVRTAPVGHLMFTINGFTNGQTRVFEKRVEELEYEKIGKDITNCDIFAESAY
jgi:hypothetical protein